MADGHDGAVLHHFTIPYGRGRELLDEERALELLPPPSSRPYTGVSLSGKSFSLPAARVFADRLERLEALTDVDLSDIIAGRNTEEAIAVLDALCRALSRHQLHSINLSDNAIGARGVAAVSEALRSQRTLRRVLFNNNGLEGSAVRVLVDALLFPFRAGERKDDGSTMARAEATSIRHIEFSRNLLRDDGPLALVPLVLSSPQLSHFCVSRVTPSGGLAICSALASLSSLVHLNLSDSTLGPEAGLVLARQLLVPSKTQRLTHLLLGDVGVNDRHETGRSMSAIIAAIGSSCPHLQQLDLHQNDLTPRQARSLARALRDKAALSQLNLDDNAIGSSGAIAIATALCPRSHPHLQQLSLQQNAITAAALQPLLDIIKAGRLRMLGLNGNRLTAEAVDELRRAIDEAAGDAEDVLGTLSDNDEDDDEDEADDDGDDVVEEAEEAEDAAADDEQTDDGVDALAEQLQRTGV